MTGFGFVYAVSALYFRPSENLSDFATITIDQDSESAVNPFLSTFQIHTPAIYLSSIFPILQFDEQDFFGQFVILVWDLG